MLRWMPPRACWRVIIQRHISCCLKGAMQLQQGPLSRTPGGLNQRPLGWAATWHLPCSRMLCQWPPGGARLRHGAGDTACQGPLLWLLPAGAPDPLGACTDRPASGRCTVILLHSTAVSCALPLLLPPSRTACLAVLAGGWFTVPRLARQSRRRRLPGSRRQLKAQTLLSLQRRSNVCLVQAGAEGINDWSLHWRWRPKHIRGGRQGQRTGWCCLPAEAQGLALHGRRAACSTQKEARGERSD